MIRTMIQLTESQSERLKAIAARRDVSVSELVREGVDALLGTAGLRSSEEIAARVLATAGRYHSGRSDVSTRHDGYLAEDFLQ